MEDFGAINGSEINALAIAQTRVVFYDKCSSNINVPSVANATRRANAAGEATVTIIGSLPASTRQTFVSPSQVLCDTASSGSLRNNAQSASTIIVAANSNAASLAALNSVSTIEVLYAGDIGWVKMGKADKGHILRMAYQNRLMRVDSASRNIILPDNDRSMLINREKRQGL